MQTLADLSRLIKSLDGKGNLASVEALDLRFSMHAAS